MGYLWAITDGSKAGIGAVYGQGLNWKTCWPAGFLLKKFSSAQQHYRTHKHEMITVLEALMKWEDKLLGRKFTLVTDPEESIRLPGPMVGVLSCFNFDIIHVNGVKNKVADCLSHYYEYDTKDNKHPADVNVNADVWLDPDGELFPTDCYMEIHTAMIRWSKCLTKQKAQQVIESKAMNDGQQKPMHIHDAVTWLLLPLTMMVPLFEFMSKKAWT